MKETPRVAVIIVSWNHGRFLRETFRSLASVDYPREAWKVFLVDNASTDDTNSLARELIDWSRDSFLPLSENTGFTGGNNFAVKQAMQEGFEYVYLLNPDTAVQPNFLSEAIRVAESDPAIAMAQSRLMLADEPTKLNSWGNEVQFLGFSFCGGYRVSADSREAVEKLVVRDIAAASGAAVLIKCAMLRLVGLFDDELFAYHEDVDLSWRMRLAGFRVVLAPESIVYHRYEFSRSIKKFYFMEKNRWLVHFKNLRLATLVLLAPAMVVMELGLWFYAFRSGWWREKARAYGYFLSRKNWWKLLASRRLVQKHRSVSDRFIIRFFSPSIKYQEIANPLWDYFGNPIFAVYWFIVRLIIFW